MLSRRDKLLIVPWQQRRYENHLRKIKQAMPAIDNRPPADRNHVSYKLKKKQKESERCAKIEKDNLTLLRKMNYIMRTSRVDHYWLTPPPSVAIYDIVPTTIEDFDINDEPELIMTDHSRKSKCRACNPRKEKYQIILPEERIPWDPPKPHPTNTTRSKSVPPTRLPKIIEKPPPSTKSHSASVSRTSRKSPVSLKSYKSTEKKLRDVSPLENLNSQRITISRGSLNLNVTFPVDTTVTFQDGTNEKVISRGADCYCKLKL